MYRMVVVGSFKSVRKIDTPRVLREAYEYLRGSYATYDMRVRCLRQGGRLVVAIDSPTATAYVAPFPIA